jgi:hypothetical protein
MQAGLDAPSQRDLLLGTFPISLRYIRTGSKLPISGACGDRAAGSLSFPRRETGSLVAGAAPGRVTTPPDRPGSEPRARWDRRPSGVARRWSSRSSSSAISSTTWTPRALIPE